VEQLQSSEAQVSYFLSRRPQKSGVAKCFEKIKKAGSKSGAGNTDYMR
jgi:hypothetical protein